jgi:hypothetical protein
VAPKAPKLKAAEVAESLAPITGGISTVLSEKGIAPLDEKEDAGWRAAIGKLSEKYLSEWIVTEIMAILLTAAIVLRRTKGFVANVVVMVASVALIIGAVFLNRARSTK